MTAIARQRIDADVAIVGSGFAGSLLALMLRSRGRRVVLLDRGTHPRFAIGESSTPLANLLIETLADTYDLPRLRPFAKWGTWQACYPHIACGLKRGFTFFHHAPRLAFSDDASHARQLLVAASPHDGIADTHWYRADFDAWLAREAEDAGVVYRDAAVLGTPRFDASGVSVEAVRAGVRIDVRAGFLVDASGPRGYLWRALGLGDAPLEWLPGTQALYTHFTDVHRWDALVAQDETPPYPIDDAALHHVLDGAWIWMLRFNNGVTSAGVAATDPVARAYRLADGADAWERLLVDYPSIREQFRDAKAAHPFVHTPRVAHRVRTMTGPCFALLPSAAGVVDPLLSTGFPLTLLGIGRLAHALEHTSPGEEREAALGAYAADTTDELRATERLVAALYANMGDFPLFKRLASLYFAAASFTETVRRLGQSERARGFLLNRDPSFGPVVADVTARALALPTCADRESARQRLLDDITSAVAPVDVAGLNDAARRDWYPVRAADLHEARERLGVSTADIDRLLARCGFDAGPAPSDAVTAGACA